MNELVPEASADELPVILREVAGLADKRDPKVVTRTLSSPHGGTKERLVWKDGEQAQILAAHRKTLASPEADAEFAEIVASFKEKHTKVPFSKLLKANDKLFLEFWNDQPIEISNRVEIGKRTWGSPIVGMRTEDFIYLLARYGTLVLPGLLTVATKKPGTTVRALCHVDAPVCALHMANTIVGGIATHLARQWLLNFPESAVHGLVVPATGVLGKARNTAESALRYMALQGHRDTIERIAADYGEDVKKAMNEVLTVDFRQDIATLRFRKRLWSLRYSWETDNHPVPVLAETRKVLPIFAVETIAMLMSISTYDAPVLPLEEIRRACDSKSLADFAWDIFLQWEPRGKSDNNWMFQALGYFGDSTCALKLTPYIHNWPQANMMGKAIMGLEILAAIGTNMALAQVQSIALKCKYKPVQEHAQALLEGVALARNLTPDQLEDLLVPTLGLSDDGTLVLDYGTRHFIGWVDERLKPYLADSSGDALKELPKAAKDDDQDMAKRANETWSEFRAELKPASKLQLARLENAMIIERRWSSKDFKSLVVTSPLLQNVVRGLVWGIFSKNGELQQSFRVAPDCTLADASGEAVTLADNALVGIPHPLTLGASVDSWMRSFTQSKQGQPFPQLVRKTYRQNDDTAANLFGLQRATVPTKALKGLKALGWDVVDVWDGGWIGEFHRRFLSGTVSISFEPGVSIGNYELGAKEQKLNIERLPSLNEIEYSEMLRELQTLTI